jgi:hypothetical protein
VTPPAAIPAPRLIAILAADAVGYSLLMAADDRLTVELLDTARAPYSAKSLIRIRGASSTWPAIRCSSLQQCRVGRALRPSRPGPADRLI